LQRIEELIMSDEQERMSHEEERSKLRDMRHRLLNDLCSSMEKALGHAVITASPNFLDENGDIDKMASDNQWLLEVCNLVRQWASLSPLDDEGRP
jgi:hypothetical protein